MKNKFLFLLPRILVLALAIGVTSLLLAVVFKLLIAGIIMGGIVLIVMRVAGMIKHHHSRHNMTHFPGFKNSQPKNRMSASDTIVPIY